MTDCERAPSELPTSIDEPRDAQPSSSSSNSEGDVLNIIQQHYAFLVENMSLELSAVSEDMLTVAELQSITAERSTHARNVRLLHIYLSKSSHIQLDQFLDFLISSGQQYIHDYVTFQQGLYVSRHLRSTVN